MLVTAYISMSQPQATIVPSLLNLLPSHPILSFTGCHRAPSVGHTAIPL